jgi:hypothetical protein
MQLSRVFWVFVACTALAACASQAGRPLAPAPTTESVAASQAPALIGGFRMKVRAGVQIYCQSDGMTGTRLVRKTTCLSEAQYREYSENTRRNIEQIDRRLRDNSGSTPASPTIGP